MWLKKISSKKIRPKKILPATLVLTVIIVAGIGTYLLTGSHAATPYTSTTADNGALSNGATSQNCTGSSDGKCVVFSASTNSNLIFDGTFPSSGDITFGNAVWNSPNNRNNPTQSGPAITGAVDPLGSGQNVGKMTVTPQDINPCCNDARTDLESPYLMSPTMNSDVYISIPVFVPMSTVALMYGHQNNGFMVEENYGPPYNGSPTNQVNVKATSTSAFKYAYSWNDILGTYGPANDSNDQWYSPSITTDVWHTITEHIMWSASAVVGYVELWYDGHPQQFQPSGPVTGGTWSSSCGCEGAPPSNGTAGPGTRLYYSNFNAINNSGPNFADDNLYANFSGSTLTMYHGETKIGPTLASVTPAVVPEGP